MQIAPPDAFPHDDEGDSMARLLQRDPLANAFRTIANTGATVPPHCLSALDIALRQTADEMRLAGRPIERVVAHVKSLATEADILESHDRLVQDAVLCAITYYCGESRFEPNRLKARYSRRSIERTVPLEVGVDSLSWVNEELERRGAQRCGPRSEVAEKVGG